jgi:drug/metabolite transporter (DMT)-like permease
VAPRTAALTAAAMCAFAANSLLCRAALGAYSIDPLSFTAVRLLAGAAVLALAARGMAAPVSERRAWASAAALFVYAVAFSLAYTRIGAATGALALFGAVQVTMIGWALTRGQAPDAREWVGLALAVAGLLGLTVPGLTAPDPLGLALMLGAGVAWGAYSVMGRAGGAPLPANAAHFARALPLAVVAGLAGSAWSAPRVSAAGLALAVASGAVASGLGYAVWFAALRGLPAAGALLLLQEAPSARLLLCSVLVLGGIALALAGRR